MPCTNRDCGCDHDAAFVQDGQSFCSAHCVRAEEQGGIGECDCGHPSCYPRLDPVEVPADTPRLGTR